LFERFHEVNWLQQYGKQAAVDLHLSANISRRYNHKPSQFSDELFESEIHDTRFHSSVIKTIALSILYAADQSFARSDGSRHLRNATSFVSTAQVLDNFTTSRAAQGFTKYKRDTNRASNWNMAYQKFIPKFQGAARCPVWIPVILLAHFGSSVFSSLLFMAAKAANIFIQ